MNARLPSNFSIVGRLSPQEPTIENGKVFFCIRFMMDDSTEDASSELVNSYFAIGATIEQYNRLGAAGLREQMLEQAERELVGTIGPGSLRRVIEQFDCDIANFDWSRIEGTELWHMQPLGTC